MEAVLIFLCSLLVPAVVADGRCPVLPTHSSGKGWGALGDSLHMDPRGLERGVGQQPWKPRAPEFVGSCQGSARSSLTSQPLVCSFPVATQEKEEEDPFNYGE